MYDFKSEYQMLNTLSQTETANVLGCLLPKVKRMLREGLLDQVNVTGARYKRIPTQQVIKLLREELQTITMRSNTIKNALMNMQTMLDKEYEENEVQSSPKYDVEMFSYLNDPRNAELRCDQRKEAGGIQNVRK